jgi:hypothetical protein
MNHMAVRQLEASGVAQSWELVFSASAPKGDLESIVIREPRETIATLHERSPEDTFAPPSPDADRFTLVWAPPNISAPTVFEREAETWMRSGQNGGAGELVRASVRTVRVVWSKDRAVVFSAVAERKLAIEAVARFTVACREASRLEADTRAMWGPLQDDIALTHSVTARDQARQRSTDERTETVARMRMAWLRLSTSLEQLDPALTDLSKRVFAELTAAAALYERLEMSEDSIQFALDQYEVANTRLIEWKMERRERTNAITGYVFEAAIIALLAYQLLHHP